MSTDINYAKRKSSEPVDDTGLPKRPSRDRRQPARYLIAVSVSDAAAEVGDGRRHFGSSVKVNKSCLSLEELSDTSDLTCFETVSVASSDDMPDLSLIHI